MASQSPLTPAHRPLCTTDLATISYRSFGITVGITVAASSFDSFGLLRQLSGRADKIACSRRSPEKLYFDVTYAANVLPVFPMRKSRPKRPTAVDVFCGVGGLSLGVVHAGFDLIGAIDSDENVLNAYQANFKNVPTARHDLNASNGTAIRRDLRIGRRRIDLLVGGPPCQGFSAGGLGAKNDSRNEGVLSFARMVD